MESGMDDGSFGNINGKKRKVRILVDIGHPAHVHYFRNFYKEMLKKGHEILFTARKKEVSQDLLKAYNIPFVDRGTGSDKAIGKFLYLPIANWILFKTALKFKPDLFMSFSSPYAAQVSKLFGKPHIAFDDTEHARLGRIMYRPFTDVVLSPDSYRGEPSGKQILFNGYMELLYLHPNRFKPEEKVLNELGINKDEKYVVVRFVSWNATHDKGHSGISIENKRKAVKEFSKYAKVFITSENTLPADLEQYRIKISPEQIHHVLAFASLFYGESATMASESAVLGTPAIYLDDEGRGYTDDLEKRYGMVFNYTESNEDQVKSISKGVELLKGSDIREEYAQKRGRMLEERMDVTEYLIDFVSNFKK
jgi:predicted glycosyltransferase